ncbi:MAG: hypothetical protein IPK55_13640 [Streptococcus sp.]|nr:hypothetical protein [Streptococcus sp.]
MRYINLQEGRAYDFAPPHLDTVSSLAILGNTLVSGSKDKNLRFWDMNTHQCRSTIYNAHRDFITCMVSD